MSRSITVKQAKALAEYYACNTLEQRGFYSHFLRIRSGYRTLGTPDIRRGKVGLRSVMRAIERRDQP